MPESPAPPRPRRRRGGQISVYLTPAQRVLLERKVRKANVTLTSYVAALIDADIRPNRRAS